jgi:uncharacterized protein YndB with AHSA1/START domain
MPFRATLLLGLIATCASGSTLQHRHCDGPRYHDFDFWVGQWVVFDGSTKVADVVITKELDGCVVRELYEDTTGLHGTSLSAYDPVADRWRQTWVTNREQILEVDGGREGDGMSFAGWMHDGDSATRVRVTWVKDEAGVREVAHRSRDGGNTWSSWFDLSFRRSNPTATGQASRNPDRDPGSMHAAITSESSVIGSVGPAWHCSTETKKEARSTMSSAGDTGITSSITVRIHAPIAKVWEALTTPDVIRQWFFGTDTITDWKPGSPIVHKGEFNGKAYEDKGVILKYEPPRLLSHTHWSSMSGRPDAPENYERITYTLHEDGEGTELTVSEENLPGEEAKSTSMKAWQGALAGLKKLLET